MISSLTHFHAQVWGDIDARCCEWKARRVLPLVAELPFGIFLSCMQAANKVVAYLGSYAFCSELPNPKKDFRSVLKDARLWGKLDGERVQLGFENKNFLYGTATCTYQDSGAEHCPDSQWAAWERKKVPANNRSGKSTDFFEYYKTEEGRKRITDNLQKLGVNSYRISLEWSHLESKKGTWNDANFQVYIKLCQHLRDCGITPMVTLYHFSEPLWFHAKGSFEKEGNIGDFVWFAKKVFPELTKPYRGKPLVEHFCTINEPAIDAFSRFIRGAFSPGVLLNFKRAAVFLKGALKAHCLVYKTLKENAPESVKIGIVHQHLKFTCANPLLFPITSYLTRFLNDTSLRFFSTGRFAFKMPFVKVTDNAILDPKTDFVGVQYYVRPVIGLFGPTSDYAPMTQMPFCEDPEGLFEAIIETHRACKAPVIVTENGISTHNEEQRGRYITRALYAAQRAVEIIGSENFLGYYLWSFFDNFEWDMGMRPQAFGAFSREGKLKEGAKAYSRIVENWRKSCTSSEEQAS